MDVIIGFPIVFMRAAWIFATGLPISSLGGNKALTCIELGLKIFPVGTKLAEIWPLMLSQMLLEVRSKLKIYATVRASKKPDINL